MNTKSNSLPWEEQAALYAAGALPAEERKAFEDSLQQEDVAAELHSFQPVIAALASTIEEVTPPSHVLGKLMDRVEKSTAASKPAIQGLTVSRWEDAQWQDIGVPGIERRILYVDRERRCQTFLLRAAPGAVLPRHPHPSVEECYMIEGDLITSGTTIGPGDYLRFEANVHHGHSRSIHGCVLLITGALDEDAFPEKFALAH